MLSPSAPAANEEDEEYNAHTSTATEEQPSHPISLVMNPSLASTFDARRGGPRSLASARPHLDPVTEALAHRAQQAYRGEPTSPLSPRTLQRLASALARGVEDPFGAENITAADVLAPAPLAIAWYPRNGGVAHPDRKRTSEAFSAADEETGASDYEAQRKRMRYDLPNEAVVTAPAMGDGHVPSGSAVPVLAARNVANPLLPQRSSALAGHKRGREADNEEETEEAQVL